MHSFGWYCLVLAAHNKQIKTKQMHVTVMILKIVKIFAYAKRPGSQVCSTGDGVGRIVHKLQSYHGTHTIQISFVKVEY